MSQNILRRHVKTGLGTYTLAQLQARHRGIMVSCGGNTELLPERTQRELRTIEIEFANRAREEPLDMEGILQRARVRIRRAAWRIRLNI